MERLIGIGVSSGTAAGQALVAIQRSQVLRFPISGERVGRELAALKSARERSREQLTHIRQRIAERAGTDLAAIFDAQLLILEDPLLLDRAATILRTDRVNAEWAVQRALDELAAVFNDTRDPYLRERKGDLHDVAGRLRMNLRNERGGTRDLVEDLDTPCVLIADELTPSVVAQIDWTRIRGFATDAGSRTYHTAILARSLGVPAVVGLHDISVRVSPGASVLLDGDTGEVIVDPSRDLLQQAEARTSASHPPRVSAYVGPEMTADGIRVHLHANIERSDDVPVALAAGAEGIGLYRSEFLLAGGPPDMAGEDEQYETYRELVRQMAPRPVTIRTFDVDKRQLDRPLVDSALDARWFEEPDRVGHAGLRGIRFGLAQPTIFKTQLRALLRAAAHGQLRILFPFVSSLHEVRAARRLLGEALAELETRGAAVGEAPVGIMIEVPSAAFTASLLAPEVDFLTIGTNDLIQYTLAVDRTDDRVSDRYEPLHPAILKLIRQVRRAAARARIPLAVCGEMAADPLIVRLLIGCGLTEFSMTPGALAMARRAIRETSAKDAARVMAKLFTLSTVDEIEQCLFDAFGSSLRGDEVTAR